MLIVIHGLSTGKQRHMQKLFSLGKSFCHCNFNRTNQNNFAKQFFVYVISQETKHVKIGHVKIDRAHFRVHFRVSTGKFPVSTGKFYREHSRGSRRGDRLVCFAQKGINLRGHFRGHLRVHSRVHFREHFRERVRGSNFAVRVLCAFPSLGVPPMQPYCETTWSK